MMNPKTNLWFVRSTVKQTNNSPDGCAADNPSHPPPSLPHHPYGTGSARFSPPPPAYRPPWRSSSHDLTRKVEGVVFVVWR